MEFLLQMPSAPAPVLISTSIKHGEVFAMILSRIVSQSACCCPADPTKIKMKFSPNIATSDAVHI